MKKITRTIVSAAVITALFAAFHVTAMAAIDTASSEVESSHVVSSQIAAPEANVSRADLTVSDIMPIAEGGQVNPRTGAANMAIPGVVALIAAATAAITLAGKKK